MIVFLLNSIFYLCLFINIRRKSQNYIGIITVALYFVLSIFSIFMVMEYDNTNYSLIDILPLIYLFVVIALYCNLLSKYNTSANIYFIDNAVGKIDYIFYFCGISVLYRLPDVISNFSTAVAMQMIDSTSLSDTYNLRMESFNSTQKGSFHYLTIIFGMFDRYIPFFLTYYLTRSNRKFWITLVLIISFLFAPVAGLCNAQRGEIMNSIFSLAIGYLIFKNYYEDTVKKWARRIGIFVISSSVIGFALITISRFSQIYMDEGNLQRSVIEYAGQPMVNFSNYGFDPGGCRWGDRTIPLLKSIIAPDGAYTYAHRMAKYTSLKMNEGVFSTFIGDVIVDYGVFVATLLFLFILRLFKRTLRKSNHINTFQKLLALYILSFIVLCGWNLYPFADYGGNLSLLVGISLYLYFDNTINNKTLKVKKT